MVMMRMIVRMHCQMGLLSLKKSEMMKIRLFDRVKDIVPRFKNIIFSYLLFLFYMC
jgi:hypothetical protein